MNTKQLTCLHAKQQISMLYRTHWPLLSVIHGLGLEVTQTGAGGEWLIASTMLCGPVAGAFLVHEAAGSKDEVSVQ